MTKEKARESERKRGKARESEGKRESERCRDGKRSSLVIENISVQSYVTFTKRGYH